MKKLLLACFILLCASNAMGKVSCTAGNCGGGSDIIYPILLSNCASVSTTCYTPAVGPTEAVYSCDSCESGYDRVSKTAIFQNCARPPMYYACEKAGGPIDPCAGCTGCDSDFNWTSGRPGYQEKKIRRCNCDTCEVISSSYRCAINYYGTSSNGVTGCTRCPSNGKSIAGNTLITGCYLPTGTSQSDSTGDYSHSDNCYYSN